MQNKTAQLSAALAPQTRLVPLAFEAQCKQFFSENMKKMVSLSGNEEDAKSIFLAAMNSASRSQFMLEAIAKDFPGFARCIITSCELRLWPGPMQECAYVPMLNKQTGIKEFQFWPMYQGLVKLAYQGGFVKSVDTNVVYENDEFDFELGTKKFLRFKPLLADRSARGLRKCAYSCIQTIHGEYQIAVVPMSFIESIRMKSPAAKSSFSPWNSDDDNYDAMANKTVFKQACKWIPKSIHIARALEVEAEEVSERGGKESSQPPDVSVVEGGSGQTSLPSENKTDTTTNKGESS